MKKDLGEKEYGLVLEGGGARGAYQIGAWKALRELGIRIKGVVGTSVGALNGAMIVQDDFEKAYDLWNNMSEDQIIAEKEENLKFSFSQEDLSTIKDRIKKKINIEGWDITPLKKMIKEYIDEERLNNSQLDYGLVTISLSDFKPLEMFRDEIPKGLLQDFLLASAYLPFFKREKLHGKYYIDGGFHNKTPTKMLINKGYKNIIVIRIHGIGIDRRFTIPEDVNIITIDPKADLGSFINFSCEQAKKNLKLGYYDALRVFNDLKGTKYYIECNDSEEKFLQTFLNMDEEIFGFFVDAFGSDYLPKTRNIFENILPRTAKKIGLNKKWNYRDLFIGMCEYFAENVNIDTFKVYRFEELIQLLYGNKDRWKEENILQKLLDEKFDKALKSFLLANKVDNFYHSISEKH